MVSIMTANGWRTFPPCSVVHQMRNERVAVPYKEMIPGDHVPGGGNGEWMMNKIADSFNRHYAGFEARK